MDRSHAIARLTGPILAVIGIGFLANGATYEQMAQQFVNSMPLIYFSGVLAMLGGLAILNMHPRWTADWRSAITAFGWLLLCVGTFRLIAPQFVNFAGVPILAHGGFFIGAGLVFLAFGGFLTFKGYGA